MRIGSIEAAPAAARAGGWRRRHVRPSLYCIMYDQQRACAWFFDPSHPWASIWAACRPLMCRVGRVRRESSMQRLSPPLAKI